MLTTQKEVRTRFWEVYPAYADSYYVASKRQNEYPTDVRCAFVDYVDMLQKSGEITEALAQRVTL